MKRFLLAVLVVCLSIVTAVFLYEKSKSPTNVTVKPPPLNPPKTVYAQVQDQIVSSPDGTHKFIMRQKQMDQTTLYTFFIQNDSDQETLLFEKTIPTKETMSLPLNTWSPDNVYVFINHYYKGSSQVYVINTKNEVITDEDIVDITAIFKEKKSPYTFIEATGWAAPQLLIVETTYEGKTGPSFWYDVTSKGFIQLARHQ